MQENPSIEEDKKEYEISFIGPSEDVALEVEKLLNSYNGAIYYKGPVTNFKLAYPIKKNESGFFGYYHFNAAPVDIKPFKEAIALNPKVLRFLIITPPPKSSVKDTRSFKSGTRERDEQSAVANPSTKVVAEAKPAEPVIISNEGLEKKLEEILK